jgi:predicted nicotinamide N-methyase
MDDGGEAALRERFDVREERFEHGGWAVELLLPAAADRLIDEDEFADGERLPYWAELWPSARALARHLLDAGRGDRRPALELGSGLALPSLALRGMGVDVLATDWYDDALRFARANAARNGLAPLRTAPLDWRAPPAGVARTRILAADVLYEPRNAELLAALLPRVSNPGADLLLADPGRLRAPAFLERMRALGWAHAQVDERTEPSAPGATSTIRIHRLTAPT